MRLGTASTEQPHDAYRMCERNIVVDARNRRMDRERSCTTCHVIRPDKLRCLVRSLFLTYDENMYKSANNGLPGLVSNSRPLIFGY